MSRISIDVTEDEHKKLKAMAALRGQSIKDYVLAQTLEADEAGKDALVELEKLLDSRIKAAQAGAVSRKTTSEVFAEATRKRVNRELCAKSFQLRSRLWKFSAEI